MLVKHIKEIAVKKPTQIEMAKGSNNYVTEPDTKIEITDVTLSPQYKNQLLANKKDKISRLLESYSTSSMPKVKHTATTSSGNIMAVMNTKESATLATESITNSPRQLHHKNVAQDTPFSSLVISIPSKIIP